MKLRAEEGCTGNKAPLPSPDLEGPSYEWISTNVAQRKIDSGFALTAQQSAKEPLGGTLIAARLQQNIDDITVLIHGTPQILLLAIDSDEQFVQIPGITESSLFLLETSEIVGAEFPAPRLDGFVRKQ